MGVEQHRVHVSENHVIQTKKVFFPPSLKLYLNLFYLKSEQIELKPSVAEKATDPILLIALCAHPLSISYKSLWNINFRVVISVDFFFF